MIVNGIIVVIFLSFIIATISSLLYYDDDACFAVASTVYVTVNLSPLSVWNASALPANDVDPEAIGVPLDVFVNDIATAPSPNCAINGCPWAASAADVLCVLPCDVIIPSICALTVVVIENIPNNIIIDAIAIVLEIAIVFSYVNIDVHVLKGAIKVK